jgi:hypothetical protein
MLLRVLPIKVSSLNSTELSMQTSLPKMLVIGQHNISQRSVSV